MRLAIIVGALTAVGAIALPGQAAAEVNQTFNMSAPPARAGKPIALKISETTANPLNAAAQPPQLKRQIIRLNRGGKYNARYFPHCRKSTLLSRTKCSSRTRIGSGFATAVALPVVPHVDAPLTMYNGQRQGHHDTIYLYAIPDIGPNLLTVGEVSKQHGRYGYKLDFKIDDIQTLPGAPNASITSVSTSTPIKYRKRHVRRHGHRRTIKTALITAPSRCHRRWIGESEFQYANGEVKKIKGSIPCKRSHRRHH